MTGILSLITFAPAIGAALILALRAGRPASPQGDDLARWIAFGTSLVTLGLSVLLTLRFDNANPGFQFVEDIRRFALPHGR
jgi:NADH-quinone oxidoreductase subunit M